MKLHVDNKTNPKRDFKVGTAKAKSNGGAKWSVVQGSETTSAVDFKGPIAKAEPKANGKVGIDSRSREKTQKAEGR